MDWWSISSVSFQRPLYPAPTAKGLPAKNILLAFVAKSHVRTALIIIDPPSLNQVLCLGQSFEPVDMRRKAEVFQMMFVPLRQGRYHNIKGCYIRYIRYICYK